MNQHSSIKRRGSLLERASERYDFREAIRAPVLPEAPAPAVPVVPVKAERTIPERPVTAPTATEAKPRKRPVLVSSEDEQNVSEASAATETEQEAVVVSTEVCPAAPCRYESVDRESLLKAGFIVPDAPVSALAEELRIIKRQLLAKRASVALDKRQTILVCSAQPDEGKTFCAVNLALSLAGERDVEVLLVDGDFAKPEILSILGIKPGPGLIDAIADPDCDPNEFVIGTDVEGLSVLPAGRQANNATELLASGRTREVLEALTRDHPRRIVLFDSPPALMASPASVLAGQVGQLLLVVRADRTTEPDLKEAVGLLSGCEHLSLLLNGAGFAATGRRFGAYYGYGQ